MKKYLTLSWINTYVFLGIYVWYVEGLFFGETVTNIATWLIFSVTSIINAFSYYFSTGKNIETSKIYFASSLMCLAITLSTFFTGQFSAIGFVEKVVLILSALSLIVWYIANKLEAKGSIIAQLINIFVVAIAFIPLYFAQAQGRADEFWFLWMLWCFTLLIQCYIVVKNWKNNWIEIVGPVTYFWLHVFVVLLDFI